SGRAANRVVAQRDKSIIKHVIRRNSSDRNAHAISRVTIETRLRTIGFASHNDWLLWRRMKSQLLRLGREGSERLPNIIQRSWACQLHSNRRHVAVAYVDAIALRTD